MTDRLIPKLDRNALIVHASSWIGTPYRHQGAERNVGCDCLGLIIGLWRALYGHEPSVVPPYSRAWDEFTARDTLRDAAERFLKVKPIDQAQPGDVLFFRWRPHYPVKHCGLLTTEARMIHAYSGACVVEATLTPFWQRKCVFAAAFPNLQG